jgi:AraC-like DNA-binding protein
MCKTALFLVWFAQILGVSIYPDPINPADAGEVCWQTVTRLLTFTDQSRFTLRIPQLRDHVEDHPGMHFHFAPDFVVALGGRCRLEFVHEEITLEPDEMAVIPAGIPHREVPIARPRDPFENLVVSIYNQTVSAQVQRAQPGEQMLASDHAYFDSAKDQLLIGYLEEMSELYHSRDVQRHFGIKGLVLAYLGAVSGIIQHARESPASEKLKISQARRYVQEYLGSPELNVQYLAALLHCSADYLSHLFHQETGQRLVVYINRERVKVAKDMLRNTSLSVSEVGYALGYESQAYFSRVFKKVTGHAPVDFRRLVERSMIELEGRPRTIYASP